MRVDDISDEIPTRLLATAAGRSGKKTEPVNRVGSAGGTQVVTWHRAVATQARKRLFVITALIGVLAAVAVIAFTPPASRTFALVAFPVQTLMSVLVPFSGVLLASDLQRAQRGAKVAPMRVAAAMLAAAFALFGVLVCTIAIAVAPSEVVHGRWQILRGHRGRQSGRAGDRSVRRHRVGSAAPVARRRDDRHHRAAARDMADPGCRRRPEPRAGLAHSIRGPRRNCCPAR